MYYKVIIWAAGERRVCQISLQRCGDFGGQKKAGVETPAFLLEHDLREQGRYSLRLTTLVLLVLTCR